MEKKKLVTNILLVIAFIVAINTIQTYVLHITRMFGDINFHKLPTHIFGIISCGISLASTTLAWKITTNKKLKKVSKIIIAFVFSIVVFGLFTSIFYVAQRFLIYGLGTNLNMLIGNFVFTSVTFHLYISGLSLAYFSFKDAANTAIHLKTLQKDKEMLQYKMLQKNLEPHFLFNNLSVLSGLVKKNPSVVDGFIEDFSNVYRYYLDHNNQELVPLVQELEFLDKYISLMKMRFANAYSFIIDIDNKDGFILPCALQLVVENAIKHNRGSDEDSLKIVLSRSNDVLIVTNDLKPVDFTQGSQLGNQFLQKSYEVNFGKEVVFTETSKQYIVEIPVIL